MPIRINLLAEAQAADEMRRKDPVKRALWFGGFLVVLVGIWVGKLQWDIQYKKEAMASANATWNNGLAKYSAVTNNQAQAAQIDIKINQLDHLSTNRFLWAPLLNALQRTVVDNIEVIHIHGDQSLTKDEATKKGVTYMIERTSLSIDAKDYDPNNQNYDKYKLTLNNDPYFTNNVDPKDSFVIDGVLSPLTADPNDPSRQFVSFTLTSHFKERRRDR
jgi:hypothetical protein